MNAVSIYLFILSIISVLGSAIGDAEYFMPFAQYILLCAILVEVSCVHDTLKEE